MDGMHYIEPVLACLTTEIVRHDKIMMSTKRARDFEYHSTAKWILGEVMDDLIAHYSNFSYLDRDWVLKEVTPISIIKDFIDDLKTKSTITDNISMKRTLQMSYDVLTEVVYLLI